MVGKRSGKALLREEGLERTDNGMKQSSWPEAVPINQKNYYTEYMKKDSQILVLRTQEEANREQAYQQTHQRLLQQGLENERNRSLPGHGDTPLALNADGEPEDDQNGASYGLDASKIIVIHPGSQNLRIGLASDALPKSLPMCIASKWSFTESSDAEPIPQRVDSDATPEHQFGDEFTKKFKKLSEELKIDMRANKRKVLPNSKDLVVSYNKKVVPEEIPEHNDPIRIEWTETENQDQEVLQDYCGTEALRIPDNSAQPFHLKWPIQHGWLNERDWGSSEHLYDDIECIIETALRKELGLTKSTSWEECSCVFVIPDLYDKRYVEEILRILISNIGFKQVSFFQEGLAATYGAAYSTACVVDIGAQKTAICCVEDGMIIEDSRINLKFGGWDVTETFMRMMLHDYFPYADINLKRRYDYLLAEELKIKYTTFSQANISVQLYDFHLRAPKQRTRKYQFKTYDETILAPMGFFDPSYFSNGEKLRGRRKLIPMSFNAYDPDQPDDPTSSAQLDILKSVKPNLTLAANPYFANSNGNGVPNPDMSTPQKEKTNPFNQMSRIDSQQNGDSRITSAAGSPAPDGAGTPAGPFVFGANGTSGGSPGPNGPGFTFNGSHKSGTPNPVYIDPASTATGMAKERDTVLPIAPLDISIITSIFNAAKGDEKKLRDFFGGIMVIGGGAKSPNLLPYLEEKLKAKRPDLADRILVGTSPREMDGQVVAWKGASVYARMRTHESWVGKAEYERLGARALHHKILWQW